MIINHNLNAMNAQRNMSINTFKASKAMEKLSSGLRINRAGDDAAGLAISEKMRAQIKGLDQASRNAQDGISMIQTAEGALNETHSILQRMRELSVQASNDTNTTQDRGQIQQEVNQLTSEINRISNTTQFNTQNLLDKDGKNFELQIGANKGQSMEVTIDNMGSEALKITNQSKEYTAKITAGSLKDGLTIATKDAKSAKADLTISVAGETVNLASIPLNTKDSVTVTADEIISKVNTALSTAKKDLTASLNKDGNIVLKGTDDTDAKKAITVENAATTTTVGTPADTGYANPVTNGTDNKGIASALDLSNHDKASSAIATYDTAINTVSTQRARLGAYENRLEHTINNLGTSSENLTAAESRIRDVDMAKAMMQFSKENILTQAAQAMLVQANQQPQSVLQLLR